MYYLHVLLCQCSRMKPDLQRIMVTKQTKMELDISEEREKELGVDDVEMASR